MALSNVITGSSSSATSGTNAAATPSMTPTTMPSASPPSAAAKVASRCGQMRPSANSSTSATPTRLGCGAIQRVEHAGAARQPPTAAEHQRRRDQPAQPGVARIEHRSRRLRAVIRPRATGRPTGARRAARRPGGCANGRDRAAAGSAPVLLRDAGPRPVRQQIDVVGQAERLFEVVGDQQHADAAPARPARRRPATTRARTIASSEANGSSIRISLRPQRQHLRQRDALALPAAQMARIAVAEAGEAEPVEPAVGLRQRLAALACR